MRSIVVVEVVVVELEMIFLTALTSIVVNIFVIIMKTKDYWNNNERRARRTIMTRMMFTVMTVAMASQR